MTGCNIFRPEAGNARGWDYKRKTTYKITVTKKKIEVYRDGYIYETIKSWTAQDLVAVAKKYNFLK